jgi:hypothetical protein
MPPARRRLSRAARELARAALAPRAPAPSDPAPWIVAGIGGALVVAGVVLLVVTQLDIDTVSSGTSWAEIEGAYERVPILSGVGFGALGLGAAMLTAGSSGALSDRAAAAPRSRSARQRARRGGSDARLVIASPR